MPRLVLALVLVALNGCAHIPKGLAENPHQLAATLETACQIAPRPLPAEVETGCATVPDALRLAADTGEDVRDLVQRAKALVAKLRG